MNTSIGFFPMDFWRDSAEMLRASSYYKAEPTLVKLTAYLHRIDEIPEEFEAMAYPPTQVEPDLYFLGYDIADEGSCSGLSNCGFSKEELQYCQQRYLPHLNEHGLFDDLEIALDYRTYSDKRVEEHSPFYVYSLYTDKPIDAS